MNIEKEKGTRDKYIAKVGESQVTKRQSGDKGEERECVGIDEVGPKQRLSMSCSVRYL